jgi:hypothetical protein
VEYMRATLLAIAAATVLVGAVPASTASAQGVAIEAPGVGVRVGEPGYRERRHWREERYHRDRVTVGGAGCRTVTVRERMPDGTRVIRKRSSC